MQARDMSRLGVGARDLGSRLVRSPRGVPFPSQGGITERDRGAVLPDCMMCDIVVTGTGSARGRSSRPGGGGSRWALSFGWLYVSKVMQIFGLV